MKNKTSYLTQYFNLYYEWTICGITINDVTEEQQILFQDLREKALTQSGLTFEELALIYTCRQYRNILKVKTYARAIKSF